MEYSLFIILLLGIGLLFHLFTLCMLLFPHSIFISLLIALLQGHIIPA